MSNPVKLNQRCADCGCTKKLQEWSEWDKASQDLRAVVQHGDNPEHVLILILPYRDWGKKVRAWLARIHPD